MDIAGWREGEQNEEWKQQENTSRVAGSMFSLGRRNVKQKKNVSCIQQGRAWKASLELPIILQIKHLGEQSFLSAAWLYPRT